MNKDIGSVLKRYRKENQYTQENVARELNISRQAISAWENNQSYPDIENLVLLSQLYHVPVGSLIETFVDQPEHEEERSEMDGKLHYLEGIVNEISATEKMIMEHLQWIMKKGKVMLVATEIIFIITCIYTIIDLMYGW